MTNSNDRADILARIKSGDLDVDGGMRMLTPTKAAQAPARPTVSGAELREQVERYVGDLIAAEAQIARETVLAGRPLEDFGFDSVMAVNVVRAIEADYGKLPPTLLFEYQTVAAIAGHLLAEHEQATQTRFGSVGAVSTAEEPGARTPTRSQPRRDGGAVAIVGVSARFPQADTLDEFWNNLRAGRDCVTEIPTERWDHRDHWATEPGVPGKSYAKWGGFVRDVDHFDAELFNISPREAERMDPQERLFLEQSWLALEDSGSTRAGRADRQTGVYVGVMYSQYQLLQAEQAMLGNPLHLGSSYASIANRVSYVLDLHGPSFAVDSMCSSSLTALHLAREALIRGDIDLAVAGGVNVSIHPAKFIDLSQGRYAATDGRCRSFGEGGDGYVPGEGVAAVVLKRLADAEADGDRVHAVITGSALGHGGKTNGYTVPNPVEQTAVITRAWAAAGVTADLVSYVEAHGTGTGLGDPIEIAALDRALAGRADSAGRCAVGSVKSNIGHLESAAGIAGLVKVLLQIRHRELVASLHADRLNPHLDLDATRLSVQRTAGAWTPEGTDRRIAGLSSFGAGGAYAHVVIEEHTGEILTPDTAVPRLVVLSARSADRLRGLAATVAAEAARHRTDPSWLARAAHTSRIGREAREERIAVVADDADALAAGLAAFAESGSTAGAHRGTVDLGAPAARVPPGGGGLLDDLARRWVEGGGVDWAAHFPAGVTKGELPAAPLVRERYWPELVSARADAGLFLTPVHPLVRDHIVHGEPVVPAAALLELARAEGVRAGLGAVVRVDATVFEAAIVVPQGGCRVRVVLDRDADGARFTIVTDDGATHVRGRLAVGVAATSPRQITPPTSGQPVLDGAEVYVALAERGLVYGDGAQVLDEVLTADGHVFGRLRTTTAGSEEPGLRPVLLDGAFHTLIAFDGAPTTARVPYAVDSVTLLDRIPDTCWVRATPRGDGRVQVFDIAITDDAGSVVAVVDGLVVREPAAGDRAVVLAALWQRAPLSSTALRPGVVVVFGPLDGRAAEIADAMPGPVVLCSSGTRFRRAAEQRYELDPSDAEQYRELLTEVAARGRIAAVIDAWQLESTSADPFPTTLALTKAVARGAVAAGTRIVHLSRSAEPEPAHQAVEALLRTLAAEAPVGHRTVHIDEDGDAVAAVLAELRADNTVGGQVRHDGTGTRWAHVLTEVDLPEARTAPYRDGGVYLITGGLGGLGRELARHLAQTASARLVLTGRGDPGTEAEAFLGELRALGGEACYLRADCAVEGDAAAAVAEAKSRFGGLHGVFHLAGVLRDGLIAGKRPADAAAVLAPKISGARNLDAVTAEDDLDLFVLFSSAASVLGIVGQADYAYANAYLNHFAEWRERRRANGARSGRTVSVAWPLWQDGGMDVDPAVKRRIAEELGWTPLPAATGLRLLAAACAADTPVHAVFHGRRSLILAALDHSQAPAVDGAPASTEDHGAAQVPRGLRDYVRGIVAAELKLPGSRLDTARRFEYLGVESVMVMNITRALGAVFGDLPATLFFEYQSVDQLCAHLAATYPDAVRSRFGGSIRPAPAVVSAPHTAIPIAATSDPTSEPIAIVGLSGRYPMADDLDQLWANLRAGRDCVTEVPADRWDHSRYFDADTDRPGTSYSRWGGFLDDIDRFDPRFFAIAPREARLMDPQERLFLEAAWHAVEDAGYTRDELARRTVGVFAGVMYSQYQLYGADPAMQARGFVPSSLSASVANRVSYVLDLRGPSLSVDTMCSSSLTAIHLACSAIRLGDCDEAVAGGVNTIPHPNRYLQLSQGRFASTDGRCRSFGEGGDGYVPGEGVGAVVLKRLSRALADGDHIHGLIRGSAINHGGRTNGYTVPTPVAQAAVIELAMRRAGITADRVGYVEAHGTGTALGDPIEIDGLARAFADHAGARVPIGSLKSNIGHLESAAGIAALTKVLLQMRHGQLAPSLHAERLNPNIDFGRVPFTVQREPADWPSPDNGPRTAAVSSFGAGGSNAHLVIEEHRPEPAVPDTGASQVVLLSARTASLLRTAAARLADRISGTSATVAPAAPTAQVTELAARVLGVAAADVDPGDDLGGLGLDPVSLDTFVDALARNHGVEMTPQEVVNLGTPRAVAARIDESAVARPEPGARLSLRDVSFTLAAGREARQERVAIVADDLSDLDAKLRCFAAGDTAADIAHGRVADEAGRQLAALLGDAHGAAFVESVRSAGDLDRLAALWVSGVDLRTERTGSFAHARRVPLPGSPMERERHWVPDDEQAMPPSTAPLVSAGPSTDEGALVAAPVRTTPPIADVPPEPPAAPPMTEPQIQAVVVAAMSAALEIPESEFDLDLAHSDLGVDSVLAVEIVDQVNQKIGSELKPTDFFSYATLRKLVGHIAEGGPRTPVAVTPALPVVTTVPLSPAAAVAGQAISSEDVAVIGMSGRFPGAKDLDELWANLVAGRDLVREIPADRWDVARHFDPDITTPGKTYSKWGSVLEDVDRFDPDFFGLSPREARLMDPQQRLYLMEVWRALEDAGYSDRALDGLSAHAYVGTSMGDYHHLLRAADVPIEGYTFTGTHPAVLASRLSYHLNLVGPSLAIDTSCSSSLMAVHLACEAIRAGQAELAIAGGVAALSTPELHVLASKAGMLSPTGRCRPFDDAADGFVPGEGVGVVVLKGLAAATRDGDHVHGVIAGSGANQDGRSNGLTAPSAPAQAALQSAVHERFGIDPARIGYVECHGTGTRLGDPIEIEALHKAFGSGRLAPASCALGSIKSNLGHTLTAAGVAGLLKLLLCLRHGTLVPTVHLKSLNKFIPFEDGPFHVPTEAVAWPRMDGLPRLGATSSFGFSGTNVHVVVRETAPAAARPLAEAARWYVCPVSAKTEAVLQRRLDDLAAWLVGPGAGQEIRDIAHTLGVGRSHFGVRAVYLARDAAELRARISGRRGVLPEDIGHAADLARSYVGGDTVDWRTCSVADGGRTISLPAYPFADERYWIPGSTRPTGSGLPAAPAQPGPTVRTLRIDPADPIVADHIVDGKPLLPAAGHLSCVHRVLSEVFGSTEVTLRRVVWLRPVFVTEPRSIDIAIILADGGWVRFEVRSVDAEGKTHQHSRGEARRGAAHPAAVALHEVRDRCGELVRAESHYARFERIGVHYGAEFTTVTEIRTNPDEALARLEQSREHEVIPAGVLDGAIQSVAALHPETKGQRPHVPFAMDEIRLLRPIPRRSQAHIRQPKAGECTITITDDSGRACVVIEGMAYRELKNPLAVRLYGPSWRQASDRSPAAAPSTVLVVYPPDEPGLVERIADRHPDASVDTVLLDPDDPSALAARMSSMPIPDRVYFLGGLDPRAHDDDPSALEPLDRGQELGVRSLFRLVRHLLDRGAGTRPVELVSVTADTLAVRDGERQAPWAAGLFGMTRSLAKEHPSWRVGCLDVRAADLTSTGIDAVTAAVVREQGQETGDEIALRDGTRWSRVLHEIPAGTAESPYRAGGVYVVLGGAGGIGAVLAAHLAATAKATVVLLGRRERDAAVEQTLRAVETAGGRADYHRVDATDDAGMSAVFAAVRERHGAVNGVFHSAIVLRDGLLDGMAEADFEAALSPKVLGSVVLARAIRSTVDLEELDFVVFFSSAQSFSGNAGQANYSAACTFKDAFAGRLGADGLPVRVVNWGYWGEVGIVAKPGYRRRMQAIGVHSISADEGMAALASIISGGTGQVMPLKAEDRVLDKFGIAAGVPETAEWSPLAGSTLSAGPDGERLRAAHSSLDALGAAMVARSLHLLGAFTSAGETRSAQRLAGELSVVDAHAQMWPTLLDVLVAARYLVRDGDRLTATALVADLPGRDLDAERDQLALTYPEVAAHTELLVACLREYPKLLTGAVEPTEVLFPRSSMSRVEGVYRGDPLSDRLNELAAAAVAARVAGAPEGQVVHVLEIGAGTGGTSSRVLPALAAHVHRVEYRYTDVSAGFLRHGRKRFGADYPFVRFERLDIERPVAEQGFSESGFDIVVAANVLHATKDLRVTVSHAASLLRPGGWLVLSETTAFSVFATLTFGLLDGWWRWSDGDLRIPGSPLADVPTWRSLLATAGFGRVAALRPAETTGREIGQHVVVAERVLPTAPAVPRPAAPAIGAARPDAVRSGSSMRRILAEAIAETLGRAEADLDPDRPFTDYGVDSIILVELVNTLNERLGIELRTTALFDHPTLAELTEFVENEHGAAPAGGNGSPPDNEIELLRLLAAGELTVDQLHERLEQQ